MIQRNYPHVAAGQVAALVFAVAGAIVGFVLFLTVWHATPIIGLLLWAAIGGIVALLVFASQARQRPPTVTQSATADGVVAGIIAGGIGALASQLFASGAGTGSGPSVGAVVATVGAGVLGGGVLGALLGWIVLLVGGEERLARPAPRQSKKRERAGSGARKRSKRR